ncbi:unnamed protein product [Gongylonema pulchrum]|uniref:Transcriptional regulator n=1 Tax=Gongylonema pulchrum TaxID=637853 RepID=A0A183D530_9BILA|nr:unnamed protein product [Gongylonema pulchrum]
MKNDEFEYVIATNSAEPSTDLFSDIFRLRDEK